LAGGDVWRWTDERGVQRLVGTDELRSALASSVLPASTLVWRDGMKEWAPASTVPELASAAFAAAKPEAAKREGRAEGEEDSFDDRSTLKESARRATLIGLTPHGAAPRDAKPGVEATADGAPPSHPMVVPSPGEPPDRPGVTQIPPFGAPVTERVAPGAPRAPVVEAVRPVRPENGAAPKRKITTSEIDGAWAGAPAEEDETIPRRARPSELAAAAAAAAEATAAQRDARVRSRGDVESKKPAIRPAPKPVAPAPPAKKPPPLPAQTRPAPEPSPAARLDAGEKRDPVPSKAAPAAAPARPVLKPPTKTLPGGTPALPVRPPPLPPARGVALGNGPLGVPVKPQVAPMTTPVRIKPPPGSASEGAEPHAHPATPLHAVTLTGVSAPILPLPEPLEIIPAKVEITSTLVSPGTVRVEPVAEAPAPPAPAPEALPAPAPEAPPVAAAAEGARAEPAQRVETTEPFPTPTHDPVPADVAEVAPRAEPIGPLPPARAPMPSRARPAQPSHPPVRPPPLAEEASSITPAPSAAVPPTPAPPASTPVPPSAIPTHRPPPRAGADVEPTVRRRAAPQPVPVPMSSLFGAGGVLIGMVIAAFFVGRASAVPAPRLTAHPTLGAVPALARAAVPPPPKPCWMVKQPAMWAPRVSKSIPFDAVATRGGALAVGYARDAKVAVGIEVNLGSGDVQGRFEEKADEEIERVTPTPATEFSVARAGGTGALKSPIEVPVTPPFAVGLEGEAWALAAPPTGATAPLWPLAGDEKVAAATVHVAGEKGYALTFRRGSDAIFGGWIGPDRKAVGALVAIAGSGGSVGKPAAAWNGRELAVIFADRPDKDGHYEIRIGHAAAGAVPATTAVLPLPRGGPGGDAFAPDIAGLPDGRWILMWTEGASGSRAVRAQTLAADFSPLGDPIALSPPAGNYGQGLIGIASGYAATVFLSKGSTSFELWGAVLQCQ
jgi:hypothetical protein